MGSFSEYFTQDVKRYGGDTNVLVLVLVVTMDLLFSLVGIDLVFDGREEQ
jgi:hypothetical protein